MKRYIYPVIDLQKTGQNLKRLCQEKNVTPKDLQLILQLGSVSAVYNWFTGLRLPSVDNLLAISKLLQISMNEILIEAVQIAPSVITQCVK
jgi:transcriptional regulator with XRE-family HTH domain